MILTNPLGATVSNHIDTYPTPLNLTYLWGFGSLAGIALGVQIVSGVLLAMHYAAEVHIAFNSVEHIMRDVVGGWVLRYIHANGASMFFIVVYTHMFRGLYYGSYFQPRANLWYSGVVIFVAMMATAFMGYVLPWGQMSFWGATVITNLFSAIPEVGTSIVQLLWGGFSVDNPTLNRFFSLHYLLPFVIAGLALLHLILLHQPGSNNPLGVSSIYDRIPFYPYFYVKDLFGFCVFVLIFSFFVIYAPNYMGHPDNYIEANPLVTPAHIVPEWYFLPFYAILRTVPDKLGGVVLMFLAIVILAFLPVVDTSVFRSTFFKPLNIWLFWYFFGDSVSLGWIGQEIVESPFIEMGIFVTVSYFGYFIPGLSFMGFLENKIITSTLRFGALWTGLREPYDAMWAAFFREPGMRNSTAELRVEVPSKIPEYVSNIKSVVFDFFMINLGAIQVVFLATFILFLGFFFKKTGSFTKFLNKISAIYLVLIALTFTFTIADKMGWISTLELWSPYFGTIFHDCFFIGVTLLFAIFFYGIAERFFIATSYELEYPILLFFFYIAAILVISVNTLIEFVLAIEIITLGSYAFAAYVRKSKFSTYGGVQYFIIGSIPSVLLILSTALIYKTWGTFAYNELAGLLWNYSETEINNPQDLRILVDLDESNKPNYYKMFDDMIQLFNVRFGLYTLDFMNQDVFIRALSHKIPFEVSNPEEPLFDLKKHKIFMGMSEFHLMPYHSVLWRYLSEYVWMNKLEYLTLFGRETFNELFEPIQKILVHFNDEERAGYLDQTLIMKFGVDFQAMWNVFFQNSLWDFELFHKNIHVLREFSFEGQVKTFHRWAKWHPIDTINMYPLGELYDSMECFRWSNTNRLMHHGFNNLETNAIRLLQEESVNFAKWDLEALMTLQYNYSTVTVLSLLLLLTNFLFKLTAAPFQFWAPAIYGRIPVASVTFLSIFSKGLIFFAFLKMFAIFFSSYKIIIAPLFIICGVLSVLFGMIGAFTEKGIKRFFVYSSMGHVGFMLVALSISSFNGISALFHYLPVYIITSFLMWFVLLQMGVRNNNIAHFANLRILNRELAIAFAVVVFSMSGIPPLGGFFVKLDILIALMEDSQFYTNYLLLFFTVASFFYYLRIIKIIFFEDIEKENVIVSTSNISLTMNKGRYAEERQWLIIILFLILVLYSFVVNKALIDLEMEALKTIITQ